MRVGWGDVGVYGIGIDDVLSLWKFRRNNIWIDFLENDTSRDKTETGLAGWWTGYKV